MKPVELGCAGHFICARDCAFRRHTQVGNYRVSTVGDLHYGRDAERRTVGAGPLDFFETYVFRTTDREATDNDGCGCRAVESWSEIDGSRWETAGEAQRGHESFVRKYLALAKKESVAA